MECSGCLSLTYNRRGESKSKTMNEFGEIIQNVILELKSNDIVTAGDFNVHFVNVDEKGIKLMN